MHNGIVTWAEIDLDAIEYNVKAFKRHIGENVTLIAVVKANAYGHGAAHVARVALAAGAEMLAVHRLIEGVELRRLGIDAPVLIMGYTPPDGARAVVEHRLTPSLITIEFARALALCAEAAGVVAPVHVKVDSGMNRYGVFPQEAIPFLRELIALPGLQLEGLFTHFATADWLDSSHTLKQLETFNEVRRAAAESGITVPMAHAANSAATMRLPQAHLDAVRPGIALYGLEPSSEWPPMFEIRPALALKSTVSRVRELPAGAGISYSRTYVTERPMRAALVPVGYGDGYHRNLSNNSEVLIDGQRATLRGRVCMDQFVADISAIPGVRQDDEVVLVGRQGDEVIRAEEVAARAGTINYEVTTSLLPRVARVYLRGGEVVDVRAIGI